MTNHNTGTETRLPLTAAPTAAAIPLVALLAVTVILDGLDTISMTFAAPLVMNDLGISKQAFGIVLAAVALGMVIGTPIGGWAGDRWGRRRLIVGSVALFGSMTLLIAFAHSLASLSILNLLAGLGCGAVTPNAYALVSELVADRYRTRAIAALSIGFPLGGTLGALMMLALLPQIGWRGVFVCAGVATLTIMVALVWRLPESPAFEAARTSGRSAADPGPDQPIQSDVALSIWTPSYRRTTIGAALFYFSVQFITIAIVSWTPVIFTSRGLSLTDGIIASMGFNVISIVSTFAITGPLRRRGSWLTSSVIGVVSSVILAALCFALLAAPEQPSLVWRAVLIALVMLIGASCGSLFQIINSLSVAAYPPEIRATGVGFTSNGGRIGSFLAALSGGMLLEAWGASPAPLLTLLCVLALTLVPAGALINRHIMAEARRPFGA